MPLSESSDIVQTAPAAPTRKTHFRSLIGLSSWEPTRTRLIGSWGATCSRFSSGAATLRPISRPASIGSSGSTPRIRGSRAPWTASGSNSRVLRLPRANCSTRRRARERAVYPALAADVGLGAAALRRVTLRGRRGPPQAPAAEAQGVRQLARKPGSTEDLTRPSKADLAAAVGRQLPDVIGPGLRVLFCGINPGLYSAAVGHHFARPGNRFWPALHAGGFSERLLAPSDDHLLSAAGYGLTNLVDRATASARELTAAGLIAGLPNLEAQELG